MQKVNPINKDLELKNNDIVLINNLHCVFNEGQENQVNALNGVDLSFEKNKIHFIIGNSGSGKSTLVYHFNGLIKSKKGDLNINNFLILGNKRKIKNPKKLRRIVSMVFQFPEYQLFKDTILKDISFGPKVLGIPKIKAEKYNLEIIKEYIKNEHEFKNKIIHYFNINDFDKFLDDLNLKIKYNKKTKLTKIKIIYNKKSYSTNISINYKTTDDISYDDSLKYLEEMGLDESYLERNPFGLSGGQKRRVAIAGILAIEPNILIFDEPTAGLDPMGEQEMMETILRAKNKGQTIVVITHTMDHVLQIGDNVIVLKDGKPFLSGDPYDVFLNPKLLTETKMEVPKIIDIINRLVSKDKKYKKLYELKPRTIEELSAAITKIKKGK
ncbi:ATP-binding cassette domain-containing protein [Malacoplasma muris]|uniref:ATP-binding cassette domain-containing protein n=1 Tax=Malacoplasma muris TaxID=2119 RepID=UPI00398F1547